MGVFRTLKGLLKDVFQATLSGFFVDLCLNNSQQ